MDIASLQALVSSLLLNISAISGYSVPESLPKVSLVPSLEIQKRACSGPCRVRAIFVQGEGVFLDAALNLKESMYDQSILVHELVHALQHTSGGFDADGNSCAHYEAEEIEAYDIQNKFLSQTDDPRRFAFTNMPGACKDPAPQ